MSAYAFRPVSFDRLEGWAEDDPRQALAAFRRSAVHALEVKPYRQGRAAPPQAAFRPAFAAARRLDPDRMAREAARSFFVEHFQPHEIRLEDGAPGQVTAFYEPVVSARRQADAEYRFPFLRKPADLVKIADPDAPPPGVPQGFAFALQTAEGLAVCPDREAVENGAFAGHGLEIAWARDKADVFFAQVQGCARLDFGDGAPARITYAAKSGHPFTGIGRILVTAGAISQAEISMQAIRRWLAAHPDEADRLMWRNRSYIFFEEAPVPDHRLGPIAAAKVPLEPGRSMAVDRLIHSFGTPFFVSAPALRDFDDDKPFARLMVAQDTGSAIIGAARGDLFTGSGEPAGLLAGAVNAVARFTVLLPRGAEPVGPGADG